MALWVSRQTAHGPLPTVLTHLLFPPQDTAGEEKYASLSSFYCRGASVAILAFDLTCSQSLQKLNEVFIPLLEDSVDSCLTVVVGTKLDLVASRGRQVKSSEGRELAEQELQRQIDRAVRTNPNSYLKNVQVSFLPFNHSLTLGAFLLLTHLGSSPLQRLL